MLKKITIVSLFFIILFYFYGSPVIVWDKVFNWPQKCEDATVLFKKGGEIYQQMIPMDKDSDGACKIKHEDFIDAMSSLEGKGEADVHRVDTSLGKFEGVHLNQIIDRSI